MKQLCRIISIVLAMVLVLGFFGCTQTPAETTPGTTAPQQTTPSTTAPEATVPPTSAPAETEPPATEPEEPAIAPEDLAVTVNPVLQARRDAAEAYMRQMATYIWRATEDFSYTGSGALLTDEDLKNYTGSVFNIKAGRLYRGIPYSYSGSSAWNFYDYADGVGEDGVPTVSGLSWRALNGTQSNGARLGNDCSSSVQLAWNYIGGKFTKSDTSKMVFSRGFLPVGEYERNTSINEDTINLCSKNGAQTMFAAYAQLQKADAVVKREETFGHAIMVVGVRVVFNADGTINGNSSTATLLHQTSRYALPENFYYDQELGEPVYMFYGVDDVYSFQELYELGYLPITCDALVDPEAGTEEFVHDSEKEHTFENILQGTFTSNRYLSSVEITITDKSGNVVMQASCYTPNAYGSINSTFVLAERFQNEMECVRHGELKLDELPPGTYHCTHVLRNAHGAEYTMRDFDFTIP